MRKTVVQLTALSHILPQVGLKNSLLSADGLSNFNHNVNITNISILSNKSSLMSMLCHFSEPVFPASHLLLQPQTALLGEEVQPRTFLTMDITKMQKS